MFESVPDSLFAYFGYPLFCMATLMFGMEAEASAASHAAGMDETGGDTW